MSVPQNASPDVAHQNAQANELSQEQKMQQAHAAFDAEVKKMKPMLILVTFLFVGYQILNFWWISKLTRGSGEDPMKFYAVEKPLPLRVRQMLTIQEELQLMRLPYEQHYVTTQDGQILALFRFQNKQGITSGKPVVYFQHGIFASASQWLRTVGDEIPLARKLGDEGYDIWLGNSRSSRYSRNHTALNPESETKFWHFSFTDHELDLVLEYIRNNVGPNISLHLIGRDEGALQILLYLTENPALSPLIQSVTALSPLIAFKNESKRQSFRRAEEDVKDGEVRIRDNNATQADEVCLIVPFFCSVRYPRTSGLAESESASQGSFLSKLLTEGEGSTSLLNLHHYQQMINRKGMLHKFDYGSQNEKHYNQKSPPLYFLSRIKHNIHLIYEAKEDLRLHLDLMEARMILPLSELHIVSEFDHPRPEVPRLDQVIRSIFKKP